MIKALMLFCSLLLGTILFFNPTGQNNECSGIVGDIKYSYLEEDAFRNLNGDCWELLTGQSFRQDYKLYGVLIRSGMRSRDIPGTLPDAQGMFIRGMDYEGKVDPNRKIGMYQDQSTAKPKRHFWGVTGKIDRKGKSDEEFWRDSDYSYNVQFEETTQKDNTKTRTLDGAHTHVFTTHTHYNKKDQGDNANTRPIPAKSAKRRTETEKTGNVSGHTHELIVSQGGDKETRPKNVCFYTYMRVN